MHSGPRGKQQRQRQGALLNSPGFRFIQNLLIIVEDVGVCSWGTEGTPGLAWVGTHHPWGSAELSKCLCSKAATRFLSKLGRGLPRFLYSTLSMSQDCWKGPNENRWGNVQPRSGVPIQRGREPFSSPTCVLPVGGAHEDPCPFLAFLSPPSQVPGGC